MKILIACSETEITGYVEKTLSIQQPDWELATTTSGKQCLKAVKNGNCPDLIIIGIKLEDIPCFNLIETIRDDSDIPIIVLSMDRDLNTLVRAFNAGASDYIAVPFNKAVFIARLKALHRRRTWDMPASEKRRRESPITE